MTEPVAEGAPGPRRSRLTDRSALLADRRARLLALGAVALVLVVAIGTVVVGSVFGGPAPEPLLNLVAQDQLDHRWGSYLSEREWGTPREAIGANGWGLSWRGAIDTEYRYGEDGIAGMTDADNQFNLGWAFWDGHADHVTERFNGTTNPQGAAGETITDDRQFDQNTPSHSYDHLTYGYPADEHVFRIELEAARYDSTQLTMVATATNTSSAPAMLDVVFKAWLPVGGVIEPISDGVLLAGPQSTVAVIGAAPTAWQIADDKGALDRNLRRGSLAGNSGGHIAALDYHLNLAAGASSAVRIGVAEVPWGDPSPDAAAAASLAGVQARSMLGESAAIVRTRLAEADALFNGQVTAHQPLYRQALMSLLWNESYYRWDGTSGVNPDWAGKVDVHDVLLMPDKWEYPWLASWDTAFESVTAALVDPALAEQQLEFLLSSRWQQPDGHIPCGEWVMDQECPPIFAWAAWRVYEVSHDTAFLTAVYPGLQQSYDYWWQHNQVGDALFTGGFLGMDNLPRGIGQPQADATAWMALFARDMARIASELRDPDGSARYWVDRGRIQEALNNTLWDDKSGFYYDQSKPGQLIMAKSYSGLIPLIAGVVPAERLPRMLAALHDPAEFLAIGGIRSMSASSALYLHGLAGKGINSNWRGPVWLPINYMLVTELEDVDPGFISDVRERLVGMVEADYERTGRLHEFFDGDTGAGLGADEQAGWTALVANLIHDGWSPTPQETPGPTH